MDIRLLGPIAVRLGGLPIDLGTKKQRAVFAMLALDPIGRCRRIGSSRACGRASRRRARTATAWARAERRLVDLAPAVPMLVRRRVLLGSDRVGNLGQHPKFGPLLERAPVQ